MSDPTARVAIRAAHDADRETVRAFLVAHGTDVVARLDASIDATAQPALLAETADGGLAGVLTYVPAVSGWEVLTLHVEPRRGGVGTALLAAIDRLAAAAGQSRLWLVTTNDNLDALRFYQRRGFRLVALHPGGVDRSRRDHKPTIPTIGDFGIPIRDELILERDVRI